MNRAPCEKNTAGVGLSLHPSPSRFCTCSSAQAVLLAVGNALGCNVKDPQKFQAAFSLAFRTSWCLFDYSPTYSYGLNATLFFPYCQMLPSISLHLKVKHE